MPRPDGPQFEKLYHGSREADLEPGDLIEPRNYPGIKEPVAFAAPSKNVAKSFSQEGRLYQVEPLEDDELVSRPMRNYRGNPTEVISVKGFRVVKRVQGRAKK